MRLYYSFTCSVTRVMHILSNTHIEMYTRSVNMMIQHLILYLKLEVPRLIIREAPTHWEMQVFMITCL